MRILFTLVLFVIYTSAYSQTDPPEKIKVFIDCKNVSCDNNFLRTEINLVDFVLDRVAADVHVLLTSVRTGNGGSSIQYIFYGQNSFSGKVDTLTSNLSPNNTEVERRIAIAKKIKLGLTAYVIKSEYADLIDVKMKSTSDLTDAIVNNVTTDNWNYWIINIGTNGNYNADQVYKNTHITGRISANRSTEKLKVGIWANGGYNNTVYTYEDDNGPTENEVTNSDYSVHHSLVKSISKKWSAGYELNASNSTFSNNKLRLHGRAALEYAIYPYSEVNNRFLTLNYGIDVRQNNYYDTTIYNKLSEVLWGHRLQLYLAVKQKWGNVNSSISYHNYLKDWNLNSLYASMNINVRITGGLFLNVYASGGLVRDQVYLVKGKASEEDILTRRRQIASAYNFHSGIGINFRFGSILNNFVNPRFDHP